MSCCYHKLCHSLVCLLILPPIHPIHPIHPWQPYMYRREERLAAAIAKSKDLRQQSYMRTREETLASTITSAFSGGASGIVERERVPVSLCVCLCACTVDLRTVTHKINGVC